MSTSNGSDAAADPGESRDCAGEGPPPWAWMPIWVRMAVATTASLLMALGAPPHGQTALIWLGFIPLMVVLRITPRDRGRLAFGYGLIGGLCTGLVGFPWVGELVVRFAGVPWVVGAATLLAFSVWTALPIGLWAVGVVKGPQRGWQRLLWPIAWWITLASLWPHLFPYTLVIGFAEAPVWMQAAELGGVPAVEAQVLAVGVLMADAIVGSHGAASGQGDGSGAGRKMGRTSGRGRWRRAAAAVAIVALSTGLGAWRLAAIDDEIAAARTVRVGLVQPNNALMARNTRDRMRRLRRMSAAAQAEGAQLLVWPEAGAFPYSIRRPFTRDVVGSPNRILRGFALPTIFGAGTYTPEEAWERNSVFNMGVDGVVRGRYDKVVLVPIGEYVPIIDPLWLRERVPAVSHNLAGDGPRRFEIDPAPTPQRPGPEPALWVGPVVCYEDIIPGFARQVAAQPGGIELFVNVTIDTWFGETAEPWEHLALAQFRSVEHRIAMVRSVSAGVTASIDAGGRVIAHLGVTGPTLQRPVSAQRLVTDVALPRNTAQRPTIYARGGWRLPWLCGAWGLWVLGLGARDGLRRRRLRRGVPETSQGARASGRIE